MGKFPPLWMEWNGKDRDCARLLARTDQTLSDFAYRLTGSSDLYEATGREVSCKRQLHHRSRRFTP